MYSMPPLECLITYSFVSSRNKKKEAIVDYMSQGNLNWSTKANEHFEGSKHDANCEFKAICAREIMQISAARYCILRGAACGRREGT